MTSPDKTRPAGTPGTTVSPATPKAALVTGAARRLGRAIAIALGEDGWSVAVHHNHSQAEAEEVASIIRKAGGEAVCLQADLADLSQARTLFARASEALGPITLLVNNASIFQRDDARDMTGESWDAHLDVNLKTPAFLSQAFANALPEGLHGNIINMIDQRVWRLTPKFLSYTVSKSGLWALTQVLAQSLAPYIRVNGIGPGPALVNERQSMADFARQCDATILQQGTSPQEICEAVRFILKATSMTGQMIALDGGQHLAWETPDVVGIPE